MTEEKNNMVLRTIYLPQELDSELRELAFKLKQSKGELIRDLVQEGLSRRSKPTLAGIKVPAREAKPRKARPEKSSPESVVAAES